MHHHPRKPTQRTEVRELLLLLDVDGVTRRGVTDSADPGVVRGVKEVLQASHRWGVRTHVAFLSGTPSTQGLDLPDWCGGNVPLSHVFLDHFDTEVAAGTISIYGQVGADRLVFAPSTEGGPAGHPSSKLRGQIIQGFTRAEQLELLEAILTNYHEDVEAINREFAEEARREANASIEAVREELRIFSERQEELCCRVPQQFETYVELIRKNFDPRFRLVSNGATMEYHDFQTAMRASHHNLKPRRGFGSSGIAHRDGAAFFFFLVTLTNKGMTAARLLKERRTELAELAGETSEPTHLELVTVGDSHIDYPMHVVASAAFHVGVPKVWDDHNAPEEAHVLRVAHPDTPLEAPLVEGTAHVLTALVAAIESGNGAGLSFPTLYERLGPHIADSRA